MVPPNLQSTLHTDSALPVLPASIASDYLAYERQLLDIEQVYGDRPVALNTSALWYKSLSYPSSAVTAEDAYSFTVDEAMEHGVGGRGCPALLLGQRCLPAFHEPHIVCPSATAARPVPFTTAPSHALNLDCRLAPTSSFSTWRMLTVGRAQPVASSQCRGFVKEKQLRISTRRHQITLPPVEGAIVITLHLARSLDIKIARQPHFLDFRYV